MKLLLTQNLLRFTIDSLILTGLFRWGLSSSITTQSWTWIIISSLIYGAMMWISGWHFGKKDSNQLPIYDVGFRFHLATFISHNLVSFLWFQFNFQSEFERFSTIYITFFIWSIFILAHFIFYLYSKKNSIKNLNRDELFE